MFVRGDSREKSVGGGCRFLDSLYPFEMTEGVRLAIAGEWCARTIRLNEGRSGGCCKMGDQHVRMLVETQYPTVRLTPEPC